MIFHKRWYQSPTKAQKGYCNLKSKKLCRISSRIVSRLLFTLMYKSFLRIIEFDTSINKTSVQKKENDAMNCYLIDQEIIFCHHVQIDDFITCFQVGTRIITFNPLFSHLVLELQHITFGSH